VIPIPSWHRNHDVKRNSSKYLLIVQNKINT